MTDTPARRGPGRLRKAATQSEDDAGLEGPPPVEVDLLKTPEAAAAHAAHGTTAHLAVSEPAVEDEDDAGEDENAGPRVGHDVLRHANLDSDAAKTVTHIGFDDGSQWEVEGGKLKREVGSKSDGDKK